MESQAQLELIIIMSLTLILKPFKYDVIHFDREKNKPNNKNNNNNHLSFYFISININKGINKQNLNSLLFCYCINRDLIHFEIIYI